MTNMGRHYQNESNNFLTTETGGLPITDEFALPFLEAASVDLDVISGDETLVDLDGGSLEEPLDGDLDIEDDPQGESPPWHSISIGKSENFPLGLPIEASKASCPPFPSLQNTRANRCLLVCIRG